MSDPFRHGPRPSDLGAAARPEFAAPSRLPLESIRPVPRLAAPSLQQLPPPLVVPAPTSIAGFVGTAAAGPLDRAVAIRSPDEYVARFGAPRPGDHLPLAVRAFFANGGATVWVARVADAAVEPDRWSAFEGALARLDAAQDVAIVAAPGSTTPAVADALLRRCATRGDRIALVDPPPALTAAADVIAHVEQLGWRSSYGALYWPWVQMPDAAGAPAWAPPSGFVAGVCARVDATRGVWKAPANEGLSGALALAAPVDVHDQDTLTPAGVNVLRDIPGRGLRIWGARTLGAPLDAEWRYLHVRRLASHVVASLARGLAWTAHEPNAAPLWQRVRAAAEQFLTALWREGAFVGTTTRESFFVRCGADTTTASELAAGRLTLVVGLACLRPAEFALVRVRGR